jgi:hypothetical protein
MNENKRNDEESEVKNGSYNNNESKCSNDERNIHKNED